SVDVPIYGALLTLTLVIILGVFACLVICLVFCLVGCMRRHATGLFCCLDSPVTTNNSNIISNDNAATIVESSADLFGCLPRRHPRTNDRRHSRYRNCSHGQHQVRESNQQHVVYWRAPCGESLVSCLPLLLDSDGSSGRNGGGAGSSCAADHFSNCRICSAFIFGVEQPSFHRHQLRHCLLQVQHYHRSSNSTIHSCLSIV
ncbi:hypothetical protein BOX15_Mlig016969g2, partial [Macrostomum lignano]